MMHPRANSVYDTKWFNSPSTERAREYARLVSKYPDRVPTIVTYDHRITFRTDDTKSTSKPNADSAGPKFKFLLPSDLTIGQFLYVLRKRIALNEKEALFLFLEPNSEIPPVSQVVRHLGTTGDYLYIHVSLEDTYG